MTDEEKQEYEKALRSVDWNLPGMEKFGEQRREHLTRSILGGTLVNSIHCLGWALWPTKNEGYFDDRLLRDLADFIEIQNKPFWDEYEASCLRDLESGVYDEDFIEGDFNLNQKGSR